jgi:predicted nucleic acid-binding protein
MATTAVDPVFVDTNVLVFATIPSSPFHRQAIAALHAIAQSGAAGWVSRQVLREYLVQLTRPGVLPTPLTGSVAATQVTALSQLYHVADETSQVTAQPLTLIGNGLASGKQVHDANLVATCLAYGIPRLLTHNQADFQRYASLIRIELI